MPRMAKEVERKFLVADERWRADAEPAGALRQFYLAAAPDRSVRVRIKDGRSARLTLKFGAGARERDEFEYDLPLGEAREMERFALGNVIEKTRSLVRHDGHVYEVDVFAGALAGLVVAELETEAEVPDARLPGWLGREVTGEPGYYNAALALEGLPDAAP